MNTNDEQASYGVGRQTPNGYEVTFHNVPPSTNPELVNDGIMEQPHGPNEERAPLLSDDAIVDETWVPDMSRWEPAGAYEAGMHWARRFYEALITKGILVINRD